MYKDDGLKGGHVIMLGPGCEEAALAALQAYPQGLQIGGACPLLWLLSCDDCCITSMSICICIPPLDLSSIRAHASVPPY